MARDDGTRSWKSIESQQRINSAAATRLGMQVVGGFVDVGAPGNLTNRPGLNHLLAYADENDVQYVVVNRIDRLARKALQLNYLLGELKDRGANLVLADSDTVIELVLPSDLEVLRGGDHE